MSRHVQDTAALELGDGEELLSYDMLLSMSAEEPCAEKEADEKAVHIRFESALEIRRVGEWVHQNHDEFWSRCGRPVEHEESHDPGCGLTDRLVTQSYMTRCRHALF